MKYRIAKKSDIHEILKLITCCAPKLVSHHEYVYWMLTTYFGSSCFVALDREKIVGFISGLPSEDKKSLFIWQISVHPDFRRASIGSELLMKVWKGSVKLGLDKIQFSIEPENKISQSLFKSFAKKNSLKIRQVKIDQLEKSQEVVYEIFG
jgi:L-2,4-diaminobutyric acid acetyltransferase